MNEQKPDIISNPFDDEISALLETYRRQSDPTTIHGYSEVLHHDYSDYSVYSESSCCC